MSVNFTELSDDEFYRCLFEANETLLRIYFEHQRDRYTEQARKLYFERDVAFRGFRQT